MSAKREKLKRWREKSELISRRYNEWYYWLHAEPPKRQFIRHWLWKRREPKY